MADEEATNQVREALRQWISADDEIRALQAQIKTIRDRKNALSGQVLEYMRTQNIDNLVLEGPGGTIARQERTTRARPNKQAVRMQIAILLADDPSRMTEVLRTIEGLPAPGQEPDAGSVVTRELLTRRMPRSQQIRLG
jgi:anti-sigma factor RsiW